MSGDGKIHRTAGCLQVLVRVWGCLVVPVTHLGAFGIWVKVAREQILLGKSCRPLPALSRESGALSCRGAGLGAHSPCQRGTCTHSSSMLHSPTLQHQEQVYREDFKGFKRKPSAQTGTGLAVPRDKWSKTQFRLTWSSLLRSTNWSASQLWTEESTWEILNFVFSLFISMHKPFLTCLSW